MHFGVVFVWLLYVPYCPSVLETNSTSLNQAIDKINLNLKNERSLLGL